MGSEMEIGRVEGVQHMAGTPLQYAVVGKFAWGGPVFRWDSMCSCGDRGMGRDGSDDNEDYSLRVNIPVVLGVIYHIIPSRI